MKKQKFTVVIDEIGVRKKGNKSSKEFLILLNEIVLCIILNFIYYIFINTFDKNRAIQNELYQNFATISVLPKNYNRIRNHVTLVCILMCFYKNNMAPNNSLKELKIYITKIEYE